MKGGPFLKLFLGLDVSSKKFNICFLTDSKEILFEGSLSKDLIGATIMNLLTEEITLDKFSKMPLEEVAELLQKLGKGRFKNPEQLVKTI